MDVKERMGVAVKDYILNKEDVVKFIMGFYKKINNGRDISRIKLQKSLYFLYAYWIKFYHEISHEGNELYDLLDPNHTDKLFDSTFAAWSYGPVDTGVYANHKYGKLEPFTDTEISNYLTSLRSDYPLIEQYLVPMTKRIFNTSDFSLVDLSHKDKAWKLNYDQEHPMNSGVMTHEQIKDDYLNGNG